MKKILVKEVMIPIAKYVTVKKEDHLLEVLHAIERKRQSEGGHAHRDAIVVDENGQFFGKITMLDIFRALEPSYENIQKKRSSGTLTDAFVRQAVKDFNLWLEPAETICQRGGDIAVADFMYVPGKTEYLNEDDNLEKALNYYVMGVHQPLIVKDGSMVTGILRFGDVFEIVRQELLSCKPL